jgi:hypothetical protein
MEADASGRVELSGYVSHEPREYWNGDPPMDRVEPRFRIIDPSDVAACGHFILHTSSMWSACQTAPSRAGGACQGTRSSPLSAE